jgi:hypothetical protein
MPGRRANTGKIDPGVRAGGRLVSAGVGDAVSATGRSPDGVTVDEVVFKEDFPDKRAAARRAWHTLLDIRFSGGLAPVAKSYAEERRVNPMDRRGDGMLCTNQIFLPSYS